MKFNKFQSSKRGGGVGEVKIALFEIYKFSSKKTATSEWWRTVMLLLYYSVMLDDEECLR